MEQQILQLRNQGLNYNQIANELGCSRATVRYHIEPQAKANTKTRVELQRAVKKKAKMKVKENFVIKPNLKPLKKVQPKIEVKEPAKKPIRKAKKIEPTPNNTNPKKRIFKNKDLNLKEKICVRLDHKTEVYVEKGYNIEKLRKKYLKK